TLTAKVAPLGEFFIAAIERLYHRGHRGTQGNPAILTKQNLKRKEHRGTQRRIYPLSPKIAVPTRTHVAPSSMATSKSCDMPMERTALPIVGSSRAAMLSRS